MAGRSLLSIPLIKKLPRYTFRYTCDEEPKLKLKDGSLRIFLNTTATKLSALDQKLQAFYHYLQEGKIYSTVTKVISKIFFNKEILYDL